MSERISVGVTAFALSHGACAAGRAFSASLARDAARARTNVALARHEQRAYREASVAIAQRDVLAMLGL